MPIVATLAGLVICLGVARLIVWGLEARSLSEPSHRRPVLIVVFLLVVSWPIVFWLETIPH